jgi:thiamine-monophosphate kinase
LSQLRRRFPPAPPGEVWIGDDAAVLRPPEGPLLLAADALVEGVHWDPSVTGVDDAGWKALAVNVSDLAAMGGRPLHAVVTVAVPPGRAGDLDRLYDGLEAAAKALDCPVVGGDLTGGPAFVVTVAVTGTVDGVPVLRSGARPGDLLLVTGPLGGASAALRERRAVPRVTPRVAEGIAARLGGATAMLDLSDGLLMDLRRLAEASGVGVVVDDGGVPVADGASLEDALGGGDDYELLFAAPALPAFPPTLTPPVVIGRCTPDPAERRLGAGPLPEGGWEHDW